MADLFLPQLGEAITEGTVIQWFKRVGDHVALDEPLYEVSTDKVDSEVPSPVAGVLLEIVANEGAVVEVGGLLARFEIDEGAVAAAPPVSAEPAAAPAPEPAVESEPESVPEPKTSSSGSSRLLSPVVRALLADNGVDPARVAGTGVGGRITRADVENFLRDNPGRAEPFNSIRRITGRHMVSSKSTSPHVLTAIEVDFEGVEMVRQAHRSKWKEAEGSSLTYLPFIVRAVVEALADFPRINASVGDGELIVHGDVNLAVAVDLNFEGLLAPVIRGVDAMSLTEVARAIVDMSGRARAKKLLPDDLADGTFTITNAGQYGTMLQFPIINQPQVAILSTDGVSRKPVVVVDDAGTESVAIHSVGVLALGWDHRAFDGAYVAAFLAKLREVIQTHDWESEF
ncbi:MAG TPA: dihydrolipoyllysine-residue succinyltransferase [Acidimicrobiaceae bacterium]|jgi:2-oxoglutarate dehydrogenase E2 component (dihydrolipoamide succinyltransferase)|nr:dihydrolipoyllysine-residue succinyltransferase [Acidimicrobiaceae bacterium]MDP7258527.1 dihydrolipoamide acetyltransferase family protein [Acidimicrobiales bacterium]HCV36243.1 dihydrolipoyllysine-residue succinyltransferase [Acidimicrobiaceae bacterium]HJO80326.1 dihydrolipoamide acetyltransferase family protein [Acidimicrobiales bacterium]|tara:strand:- start:1214 stop:2410 length:1197 start_codon:yes stop_codon:yes gene_type:complete